MNTMIKTASPEKRKLYRSLILVLLFGFICLQVFRWQTYAVEVTWLSLKSSTVGLEFSDHLRWGRICNSIGNYECSEEEFTRALYINPKDVVSVGNLAIARAHLEDPSLASRTFEQYFAMGGLAYDVMYFYAQHLLGNGYLEKGIDWLYRSLSVHTSNQRVANELIDQLTLEKKFYEALSLTGALLERDPGAREFWQLKYDSLKSYLNRQQGEQDGPGEIRIPSLDGKNYLVPIRYDESAPWQLFRVDRSESTLIVNREMLSRWSYELYENVLQKQQDSKERLQFHLPTLQVGPWKLKDVEAVLCEKCQPRLGRSILNFIEIEKGQDQIMDYILIRALNDENE